MIRQPAVAGQFYSDSPSRLRADLAGMIPGTASKRSVKGVIAPHAGYIYSGAVAGELYGAIEIPATVLILGPNHRGIGAGLALYPPGNWLTPLGTVAINSDLTEALATGVAGINLDHQAHLAEHSLEVQVPFLQYLQPELSIAAICVGHTDDFAIVHRIGTAIATVIKDFNQPVLIVASSDMTHYEPADTVRHKDQSALDQVLNFNPEGLMQTCHRNRISMCGVIPAAIMMVAVAALGGHQGELLAYGTSGDITGDNRQVVGYASLALW